jgi:sulfur-oxidizing protein SoxY
MNKLWNRRETLRGIGIGASAALLAATFSPAALADAGAVDALIAKMFGGKAPVDGAITMDLPEIAENGNAVPFSVSVDSPMTADNYVKAIHIFAEGNPRPDVVSFRFSPKSGRATASARMRMAKTQNIIAVAELSDGSLIRAQKEVKVTIGGCGG